MHFWEILIREHQAIAYLGVFLGMFIEADVIFLIAAIFAGQGFLDWYRLIAISFIGVTLSDMLWHFLGRISRETKFGNWIEKRFSSYHVWFSENFKERYGTIVIFTRYISIISRLVPFLAGWEEMKMKKFLGSHVVSNIIWVVLLTTLGRSLGIAISIIGPKRVIRRIEYVFIVLAIVFIGGEILLKRMFTKRIRQA